MKYILPIVIFFGFSSHVSCMNFAQVRKHIHDLSSQEVVHGLMVSCPGNPVLVIKAIDLMNRVQGGSISQRVYEKERALLAADALRSPEERLYQRRASTGNIKSLSY